ncbi:hypothetical protein [Paenibacillus sp. NEAU-GSW1]|uniref:hypothetical protein n=1 Tax=Paenibacillus sp. NEAU-GSW1 TaxID=2682486 RepID=UPI0012E0D0C5|nr:hypothetical protein [Paenibacillus sp. NEAU-GSW1]MUT65035.1 hypothetical protein [Paenibacillus sp. NEAU-GSW1]
MNYKWMKIGVATIATYALLSQGTIPLKPLSINVAEAAVIANNSVKLTSNATLSVKDGQFLMQEQGKVFAYTLTINNKGSKEIDLTDYIIKLKTKSGKTYTTVVSETDKKKTNVAAYSTQTITYYAVVDKTTKLSDLKFYITKVDFSVKGYIRTLGAITFAAESTDKIEAYKAKAMAYNNATIRGALKQYIVTKDDSYIYVTMNFLLENSSLQAVNVSNMHFYAQNDAYAVYNVDSSTLTDVTLQPKERKIVSLSTRLPLAMEGKKFSLIAASTNEATVKTEIPVGVFDMPKAIPATAVANGTAKMVYLNGMQVNTTLKAVSTEENTDEGTQTIEMDMVLENIGTASVTAPALTYTLVTSAGVSYPLSYAKSEESLTLLPKIKKTITLTGEVPLSLKLDTTKVVVRSGVSNTSKGYVLSSYKAKPAVLTGGAMNYTHSEGFNVTFKSIQRIPLADKDVLVAALTITNTSTVTKKSPNLGGYFVLNGVELNTETQLVTYDTNYSIAPKETITKYVYVDVPYSTNVNTASIILTEPSTTENGVSKKLYQFGNQSISAIPAQSREFPYNVTGVGRKASVQLLTTRFYDNEASTYFYTEFVMTNKESRYSALAELGGYIQDANGLAIPITVTEFTEKVMPDGRVLIGAWTKVTSQFKREGSILVLGQAVKKSSSTSSSGSSNANEVLINPVSYTLTNDAGSAVKLNLLEIPFAGNVLSMRDFKTFVTSDSGSEVDGVQLQLSYDLEKDDKYDYVAGDHQVMIELVNVGTSNFKYSKTFAFKASEGSSLTVLEEGVNNSLSMTFTDPTILNKIQNMSKYVVNVYDVYGGAKMLVATKQYTWF